MTDKMKQIYLSKSFYFVKELYFCNPYVLGYLEPNQVIQNQYYLPIYNVPQHTNFIKSYLNILLRYHTID